MNDNEYDVIEMEQGTDGIFYKKRVIKEHMPQRTMKTKQMKQTMSQQHQFPLSGIPAVDEILDGITIGVEIVERLKKLGRMR